MGCFGNAAGGSVEAVSSLIAHQSVEVCDVVAESLTQIIGAEGAEVLIKAQLALRSERRKEKKKARAEGRSSSSRSTVGSVENMRSRSRSSRPKDKESKGPRLSVTCEDAAERQEEAAGYAHSADDLIDATIPEPQLPELKAAVEPPALAEGQRVVQEKTQAGGTVEALQQDDPRTKVGGQHFASRNVIMSEPCD